MPKPEKSKVTLTVTLDMDDIPGWGYTADDHVKWLTGLMRNMIPHYNPTVELLDCNRPDRLTREQVYGPDRF